MSDKRITRRRFLSTSGAAAGAIIAPEIVQAQTRSSAPIKIGVVLPISGVFSMVGEEQQKAMEMYLESINYTVSGRKIELIFEDETSQVNIGVAKARKLIENDRVHALLGGASTSIIYATSPLVDKARIPYIIANAGGAEITRKSKRNEFIFRTSYNIWMLTYPFAKWIAQTTRKSVYVFCPDFVTGKEFAEAFKTGFNDAGGKISGESFAPVASPDLVPYLIQVAESKPEGIFGFWPVAPGIRFLKAVEQLGIGRTSKLFLTGFSNDYDTLAQTGSASVGAISVHPWNLDLPNPVNQAFVKAFQAKHNKPPSFTHIFGWDGIRAVVAAAEKVKGDVEDTSKFAAAFKGLSFESPRGRITIDATTHDIVQDLYIRETVAGPAGGLPVNKVIATLPNSSDPFPDKT